MLTSIFTVLVLCFSLLEASNVPEKPIVVVIPSYNNEKWCERNLLSVLGQHYDNYRVLYIDDASTDATTKKVEEFVRNAHQLTAQEVFLNVVDSSSSLGKAFWQKTGIRMDLFSLPKQPKAFHKICFDDSFSQDIVEVTEELKKKIQSAGAFFTLVSNVHRAGAMANHYRAGQSAEDEEIVVTLDGDDWLSDPDVLNRINALYQDPDVWMTHGSFIEYPRGKFEWSQPVPPTIVRENRFRESRCPSHLRTYYAWLFKKIELKDFLYQGKFFPMTCDMAIMFPIAEMAGERHRFIAELTCVYNMESSLNDNKVNPLLQRNLDSYIRGKKPYDRLDFGYLGVR